MPDTTLLVQVLQIAVALAFLKGFGNPQPTRNFRIRFRLVVIILPIIGLLGLRPLMQQGTGALWPWVRYLALFQCLLCFAVTAVLCVRYRLFMPKEGGEKITR